MMKSSNRITLCKILTFAAIFAMLLNSPEGAYSLPGQKEQKTAIIVIDDFGNNARGTQEIIELPFRVTVAVMPFMPHTVNDAKRAHAAGHDVIVHMPMEALSGKKHWLGPGAITTELTDEEIRRRVHAAIDNVPYAVGMNNHMGSKATVDPRVMRNVLQACKERGLFFLDSHTNYRSVVAKIAGEVNVPSLENHIFLDDIHTRSAIQKQFMLMREHLLRHNVCIAIGHVGTAGKITASVLKEQMEKMSEEQIVFKRLSEFLKPVNKTMSNL
ncbi:divergent polysaccharide deacetylase family protein [Paenibacillus apiarius]|nr:divergent polysaccharide deacetylase family protein [Paenibacillus apiarius]